jgi:hypothetical protein
LGALRESNPNFAKGYATRGLFMIICNAKNC